MEFYQEIEKALLGEYRKKIWRPFMSAIKEYRLIEENDRVCVCISGGKDSLLLAKCMQQFQRHSPLHIALRFLCMDPGYTAENRQKIEENCRLLNIPVEFLETDVFEAVSRMDCNPCFMCARIRRGYLYRRAKELGCNKIALGHHFDDAVETLLMSLLYAGQIQGMPPMLESDNVEGMRLIRPLYKVRESEIIAWRDENNLQFLNCVCAKSRSGTDSKRAEMKALVKALDMDNPDASKNIFRAQHNVNLDSMIAWKQRGERHFFLDED